VGLVLVEDHPMTRLGLKLMLEQLGGFSVLGEAATGAEALTVLDALHQEGALCQLVLMDIGLPDMDGIEATQRLKAQYPHLRIMMLTSKDQENDVMAALAAGADAYCLKGIAPEALANAIRTVAEGAAWLDPSIARMVLGRFQQPQHQGGLGPSAQGLLPPLAGHTSNPLAHRAHSKGALGISAPPLPQASGKQPSPFPLTPRELEVLRLIVDGLSNADIAERLIITKATAKAHVHSILQKLCVDDRTQAAVLAMRQGFV
jgi:DNA-binding NarL/FixJ family response regulator